MTRTTTPPVLHTCHVNGDACDACRDALKDAYTTTPPSLLTPLTLMQVNVLYARIHAATETLTELLYGENRVSDEDQAARFRDLLDDLSGLIGDACDEMGPAHVREAGAGRVAAAGRRNHLAAITKAEQLLAAERTAGVA